jgi:parallel beta-helix repeat protein
MQRIKKGVLMAFGVFAAADNAFSATYYVSNDPPEQCSDNGPGTESQPFCTIGEGVAAAMAGDTVSVAPGTYAETIKPTRNGAPGSPIAITAPNGAALAGGLAYGIKLSGRSWITVSGFAISDTSSSGIYISGSSNVTVSDNQVFQAGDRGIYVNNSSYVTVSGNSTNATSSYGIYIYISDNITVSGNLVQYSGLPESGYTRTGIYLNSVVDSVVSGNTSAYNTDNGIYLNNSTTGVQVVSNHANNNARGYTRAAPGINVRTSSGNTIIGNISHNNEDTGIQFYSGASNNLAVNNLCFNNGDHGIDNLNSPGQRIIGNTVYNNPTAGINLEGSGGQSSSGGLLANNISVDNGLGSPTYSATKGNIRVDTVSQPDTVLDYDQVYLSKPGVMMVWGSSNANHSSLASFQAATGQEAHGLESDPQWVYPTASDMPATTTANQGANATFSGDFRLTPMSPAIDSANSGASGGTDYDIASNPRWDDPDVPDTGAGPRTYDDRGAYEYQ